MLVVALAGADRLHLPRRPPPHLRPLPGRLRDGRLLLPLHRHRRLRDRAPAGVPRGRPRARAGDQSGGAARAPAARAVLPQLRVPGRENFLRCPNCQRAAQGPLPDLRQAGRPALGPLPLLRDGPRAAATQRRAARNATPRRGGEAVTGPDRHRPAQRAARRAGRRGPRPRPSERLIPFVAAYVDDVDLARAAHHRRLGPGLLSARGRHALRRHHAVSRAVRAAPDAGRHAARLRVGPGRRAGCGRCATSPTTTTAASTTARTAAAPAW